MSITIHPGHGSAYSYFDCARQHGVDYGDVLNVAAGVEAQSRGEDPRWVWYTPALLRLRESPAYLVIMKRIDEMVAATREIFRR